MYDPCTWLYTLRKCVIVERYEAPRETVLLDYWLISPENKSNNNNTKRHLLDRASVRGSAMSATRDLDACTSLPYCIMSMPQINWWVSPYHHSHLNVSYPLIDRESTGSEDPERIDIGTLHSTVPSDIMWDLYASNRTVSNTSTSVRVRKYLCTLDSVHYKILLYLDPNPI